MAKSKQAASAAAVPLYRSEDFDRRSPAREKPGDFRNEFRRDVARLVHSPSFRRLQGKTQLFPSHENDFYRNRLTHSIEVAQIATGIATNLNSDHSFFKDNAIDTSLVCFAALAHDLGHPPFGHNGERVLDHLMLDDGGFEGNAQTLRILSRLERKETLSFPAGGRDPRPVDKSGDHRLGLNPTFRSLSSILKYYHPIPATGEGRRKSGSDRDPVKGYYAIDADLVTEVVQHVSSKPLTAGKKSLECSIMDAADDIAYSTYDLEDAFKAGFLTPVAMLAVPDGLRAEIVKTINKKLARDYPDVPSSEHMSDREFVEIVRSQFAELFEVSSDVTAAFDNGTIDLADVALATAVQAYGGSINLSTKGYLRTDFTSRLVHRFLSGVEVLEDRASPSTTNVRLNVPTFKIVETLKTIVYSLQTQSPRMKIAERRGKEIIEAIFRTLTEDDVGMTLLPDDWREIYEAIEEKPWKRRTVCDFIASMTDRYCVEFYARIVGIETPSIHKPF